MLAQNGVRLIGVAVSDGIEDAAMMIDQITPPIIPVAEQSAPIAMRAQQQAVDGPIQRAQRLRPAGGDQRGMKAMVSDAARIRIVDGRGDPVERGAQRLEIGQGRAFAGEPDGLALDCRAGLHHIVDHAGMVRDGEGEEITEYRDIRAADHRA